MEEAVICIIMSVVIALIGVFCIFCSAMNFDWFFNNRKLALLIKIFGRNVTRVLYICLGVFVVGCGILGVLAGILMATGY